MKKLIIFGTGDIGQLAHFYFTHDSKRSIACFCADAEQIQSKEFIGLPVVPFEDIVKTHPPDDFDLFIALSYSQLNQTRMKKYADAKAKGYTLASYICSRSVIWEGTPIGDNCFILENQTIQPYAEIGNNVTLWSGNHIGHHSRVGDHTFITSHVVVSGHVQIGPGCFLGVNSTLRDGITLAPLTVIGAGATVLKNTVERGVYTGVEATLRVKDGTRLKYFTHTRYNKPEQK